MTGPPGPVIPCTTLRAWSLAVSGCWPARCSPRLRSEDGRPAREGGQPLTRLDSRALQTHCRRYRRPADGHHRLDRAELAARIYAASHLTGTFTLRSGVVSNEYFDKYMFESDPALLRAIAEACVPLVPDGIDALAGLELGGIPLATMMSQLERPPDPLRPQGGQDLRHVPARGGRRARRPAALHHRGRRHLRRRDPRRRGGAAGAGRVARARRLRDRPRVGRRREPRGRGPRAAAALPHARAQAVPA